MSKGGNWGNEQLYKIKTKEQQQQAAHGYAELQIINMEYSFSDPSPHYAVDTTHTPTFRSSNMLQEAFADQQAVSSLKASKISQILRRWRAQSRTAGRTSAASRRSAHARSTSSCSRLTLVPLRCISMQLHSDDEDEEENGSANAFTTTRTTNAFTASQSCGSPRLGASRTPTCPSLPARALSWPKQRSSPLSSCTPFSSINLDEQIRDEEELECLQPYNCSAQNEESIGSKGSSPLKLNVSKQPSTPKGYLALYVGEERKRFLVKANLVNHPLFGVLLEKAKEKFGFEQKGPLTIPCEIAFFQHIMLLVESNDPFYRNADHSTILLHLNNHMASTLV